MDERLARRWATQAMVDLWGEANRYTTERMLWHNILWAQVRHHIVPQPAPEQVDRYLSAITVGPQDLSVIDAIEQITGHDLQARLVAYERAAAPVGGDPAWLLHRGLTSADIVENTQAILIREGIRLIIAQVDQCLHRLGILAGEYAQDLVVGRTHGMPAQLTTHGARYARAAYELYKTRGRLVDVVAVFPFRGLGGAVGTYADTMTYGAQISDVEQEVADDYGFNHVCEVTGQVGWRSSDFDAASALLQTCAVPANVALMVRLGSMLGITSERQGREAARVGSSAMPHKANPRYSERICGLQVVARGYHSMITQMAGATWFEGDVSDSCIRRVAWPGMFYAVSGVLRSFEHVLNHVVHHPEATDEEMRQHSMSVNMAGLLNAAVKAGGLRGPVHDALRAALATGSTVEQLGYALLKDPRWPKDVTAGQIRQILVDRRDAGLASWQATQASFDVADLPIGEWVDGSDEALL